MSQHSAAVSTALDPAENSPAFLLGAGRSGTTLLYKILCLHPQVGYISNHDKWLPAGPAAALVARYTGTIEQKLGHWFNKQGNAYFVKRPLHERVAATPVEGEFIYRRAGIPLFVEPQYRPSRLDSVRLQSAFERIAAARGASVMLSKRTSNNRRVPVIDAIFPSARYIRLARDGRDVARSLAKVEWWPEHTVWWDGRTAAQMEASGHARAEICARNWLKEVQALEASVQAIAPTRVLDVTYESLLREPRAEVERIVAFLGLDADAQFLDAVASLGLSPPARAEVADWTGLNDAALRAECDAQLRTLGYQPKAR